MITAISAPNTRNDNSIEAIAATTLTTSIYVPTFSARILFTSNSVPSYDDSSVTEARADAFKSILSSYNPAPITDEDSVAVLYLEKGDHVTKDNLESIEDFYSSYGKETEITTTTIDDDLDDTYDAVYVADFPVAKYSKEAIEFYDGISDLLDDDGVLVATFYSQEELDLVEYILEESEEFDIIAANMTNEGVEASYAVTKDYVDEIKVSLNKAKQKYKAAGVDIEEIITRVESNIGNTITFKYNNGLIVARKRCTDGYENEHDEDDGESDHDDYDGNHGDEHDDAPGEDGKCDEACDGDGSEGTDSSSGSDSGDSSHGEH